MSKQELQPCPFCGKKELDYEFSSSGFHTIECANCLAEVTGLTRERASIAWNTRPIEGGLRAEKERHIEYGGKKMKKFTPEEMQKFTLWMINAKYQSQKSLKVMPT